MKDSFEIKGYWWLPDNEDNQLPGTLTFSQEEGVHLDIVGTFGSRKNPELEHPTLILGVTHKGKPVTLHHCTQVEGSLPFLGFGGAKYRARTAFVGAHFLIEENIAFNQLVASYTDLDAWVDTYGFTIERNFDPETQPNARIDFVKPRNQIIELDDQFEVGIGFSSEGPNWSRIQTEVKISQRAYLVVKSRGEDMRYEELTKLLKRFSDLLQFAVQRKAYMLELVGFSSVNVEHDAEGEEPPHFPEIEIYFQPIEAYQDRRTVHTFEMLFTYRDMNADLVRQWFATYDKHKTQIDLYLALFYSSRLFIDTRFLYIAQALESLHSLLFDNTVLPKGEFRAQRKEVVSTVPEHLRKWVYDALRANNYKKFNDKVHELLAPKVDLLSRAIIEPEDFAGRVKDTRHEIVHHTRHKKTFRDAKELLCAITILTFLFEAYLLELVGFDEEKIAKIFKKKIDDYLQWGKPL